MIRFDHLYPRDYVENLYDIPYERLYDRGIRGLIFDIDNTLVPHGSDSNVEVDSFFRKLHAIGFKTLLLSNNNEDRIKRFNANIGTLYIADADKPSTTSFHRAIEMMGLHSKDCIVIGDTIFTDIAGANRAGIASILVKYIGYYKKERKGVKRNIEKILLFFFPIFANKRSILKDRPRKKLFCERGKFAYAISTHKQILIRKVKNLFDKEKFAVPEKSFDLECYPEVIFSHRSNMIKKGPGIDPVLQYNKADNIRLACQKINGLQVNPGESFSFWHLVGKTSKRNGFKEGRVLVNGNLVAGYGGGLCNLANTLHLLIMHSPMTITELHHHSDALAPDPGGIRKPYSAGTSVSYNYLDLRFKNNTDKPVLLVTECKNDELIAELRTTEAFPTDYRIVEEEHRFEKDSNGNYYRKSKIFRETIDRKTGEIIDRELKWDNRSRVMFDPALIPPEQLL